ncbi:MAG: cysteine--tRNA ligase [Solirubrobacterales bacterium]
MSEQGEIRIHDTLSGQLCTLEPRDPGKIAIYACGPTVYSRIHVGNARPFVVFMLFKRLLEHEGFDVTLVINVTDINDKIYVAARERGKPSQQLAREMTEAYLADTDRLGLGRPDAWPLASEMIAPIVDLIRSLIDNGHAYESGGDVYFSVRSFDEYGKLSNRRLDEMASVEQGEPDDLSDLKRDALDFALWKAQKPDEDSSWPSPWGPGRPGWHIECSAMAEQLLGLDFDVHGGGSDLIFPHHENEIAQSEAARDRPLARIWMHNGMVRFGEEKMAKSAGNIKSLGEALDEAGRDALILYFLTGHYRQPLAFNDDSLEQARSSVERIRNLCRSVVDQTPGADDPAVSELRDRFFAALRADFNTPEAVASMFDLVNRANGGSVDLGAVRVALGEMLGVFGLKNLLDAHEAADVKAQQLADAREQARRERDFGRADELREELAAMGYEVRDMPEGPTLVRIDR